MTRRERFVMFPEQLPQPWMRLSHVAKGLAYDWWRTFGPDLVTLTAAEVCTAVGMHPRSRRKASAWLAEMVEKGVLERCDGGLRMPQIVPKRRPRSDPEATPERTHNAPEATPERTHNAPEATPERTHNRTQGPEITDAESLPIQIDREKDRQTQCARGAGGAPLLEQSLGDVMATRFRKAWLQARATDPSMAGRSLAGFADRVKATAEAQRVEPLTLFDRALQRFVGGELDDVALRAPYAVFASRWGQLTDPRGPGGGADPEAKARRARAERERAERDLAAQLENFGRSANG